MKTLQELLQARAALHDVQKAFLAVIEARTDKNWTAEETAHFDAAEVEMAALEADIQARRGQQARAATVQAREAVLNQPANQPHAPQIQTRERILDKPWANMGEQMMAVYQAAVPNGRTDARLLEYQAAATGHGSGVPSDGGFLVQQDFANTLLERTYDAGVLASRVDRMQITNPNSDGIKMPAVDETSRADGSRQGGIRAYWADEGEEKTASKGKFRLIDLKLKKLVGLSYASDEVLRDAGILGQWLMRAFSNEFAFKVDDAIYRGDGVGKPLGILNSPALVTVAKETGQAAGTVVAENVLKMWSRMWGRGRSNSVWLHNQDAEPQLYGMSMAVGTGGVPVYMPANGLAGQPFSTLFGRPLIPLEQAETVGTVGDLVLADLSQYVMIDKESMESAISIHVRFIYDESTFRFVYRCDGSPWWNSALVPYKGTNSQSPFIALASR